MAKTSNKSKKLSHYDAAGRASMVDVSAKQPTLREAEARAFVAMSPAVILALPQNPKGDPLEVARVAGIMAAKRTAELIPMCHPVPLSKVDVCIEARKNGIAIRSLARTTAVTGVEMEALVAASVAALTVYDMCKALDKGIEIREIMLVRKSGGKEWRLPAREVENWDEMIMRTAAVLTVSDSCAQGERADRSGPATAELLRQEGFDVTHQEIAPDDQPTIESALVRLSEQVQLIVTTGGTGIAGRDVTPEATRAVCSKLIEGVPERMRAEGRTSTAYAILSRGVCGVRGRTLILNLPGSPTGASESLLAVIDILPHALDLLAGKTVHDDAHPQHDK